MKAKTTAGAKAATAATAATAAGEAKETSTVKRILLLLQCLVDHPGESAQALAYRLNLPRSTVHRLLATLRDNDYAGHEAGGTFGPGLEIYRMAAKLGGHMPYRRLAEPYLQRLSERFHETSLLTLLERRQLKMFHAASGSPDDPMRYNIRLNVLEPLVWGATARVILAHLDPAEIDAAIAASGPSPVQGLAPDPAEIMAALERIRGDGHAVTYSHRTPNTVGVGAPFFDAEGQVVGSLGFLIPTFRWEHADVDGIIAALRDAAGALSAQLGYRSPQAS
ncbi:IclR family transcriptional regulator [Bordetella genomosp. 9]|nr:IclR family transcriptional regulator [Bordetella genomosp. 9]